MSKPKTVTVAADDLEASFRFLVNARTRPGDYEAHRRVYYALATAKAEEAK